jgi:tRNA(Ile)-lysidine synthase
VVVPGRTPLPEIEAVLETRVLAAENYALPREAERVAFDADRVPRPLIVRRRGRGDRMVAFGGAERRVKSLLIEAKVPRWERDRVPIIQGGGELLWISGIRRSMVAPVTAATTRVLELALARS